MITIMSIAVGEISVSLAVKRVVSFSADIFALVASAPTRVESVEDMKSLFRSGLASPKDVDPIGGTILRVSHQ